MRFTMYSSPAGWNRHIKKPERFPAFFCHPERTPVILSPPLILRERSERRIYYFTCTDISFSSLKPLHWSSTVRIWPWLSFRLTFDSVICVSISIQIPLRARRSGSLQGSSCEITFYRTTGDSSPKRKRGVYPP